MYFSSHEISDFITDKTFFDTMKYICDDLLLKYTVIFQFHEK